MLGLWNCFVNAMLHAYEYHSWYIKASWSFHLMPSVYQGTATILFCKDNVVHEIIRAAWTSLRPLFDIRYAMAKSGKCFLCRNRIRQQGERERRDEGPVGAEFTHNLVICSGLGVSYLSSGSIIYALRCMHNKSQCVQAATSSLSRAGLCPGVSTPASYLWSV